MKLAAELVKLALKEVGTEEIDGTNCGPRVNAYKAATNLDPTESWPWCAAFICWLVREALASTGVPQTATFKRPTTAGAWAFESWSRNQDNTTNTKKPHDGDIKPGDIVIFSFSHIGIAISEPQLGHIETVEGNTDTAGSREGGGVYRKTRKLSQIRSRIRFTV